jgi:hypothetical protein
MSSQTPDYYRARATEERRAAAKAKEANVAGLHQQMAEMYDAMVEELGKQLPPTAALAGK